MQPPPDPTFTTQLAKCLKQQRKAEQRRNSRVKRKRGEKNRKEEKAKANKQTDMIITTNNTN